jgi:hypothetical protein
MGFVDFGQVEAKFSVEIALQKTIYQHVFEDPHTGSDGLERVAFSA